MKSFAYILLVGLLFVLNSCGRPESNPSSQTPKPSSSSSSAPSDSTESSRRLGTVKIPLAIVDNKSYSYQTPAGESGATNHVTFITLDDGKEVQALPYVNYKTADGTFHSELSKKEQRVELEPPLLNTELWRMVGFVENSK